MSLDKLILLEVNTPEPFACNYKLPIWHDQTSVTNLPDLYKTIEVNHVRLKYYENYQDAPSDWLRWDSYNLFSWPLPSVAQIKKQIQTSYLEFADTYNFTPDKNLWISGWLNVLDTGSGIPFHFHSAHENSYLTGYFSLSNNSFTELRTHTPVQMKNQIGSLVMFPSWVFHEVLPTMDNTRLSIGFDLFTQQGIDYFKQNNPDKIDSTKHAVKLF